MAQAIEAIAQGTPSWWELATRDVEAATKFYSALCGWTTEAWPMGSGGTYHMFKKGEVSFGGMIDANMPQMEGVPAHWMTYIHVDDVDASAAKTTELGGQIMVPPMDIPEVGGMSVVSDPTGAAFTLFSSNTPYPIAPVIVWNELMTKDQAKATSFYTKLFGYDTDDMPIGGDGIYKILKVGEKGVGGIFNMAGPEFEHVPSHWMPYIGTDNVDAMAEKTKTLGGQIIHGPADIPNNMGRFVVIKDPTGAVISFYQPAKQA